MTKPSKTMAGIRDAEAEKYANRILNTLEDADARSRSFKAGFDAASAEYEKLIAELEGALEFYENRQVNLTRFKDRTGHETETISFTNAFTEKTRTALQKLKEFRGE